ncbi:hypothetical protein [Avibacterium avium]|uniref:hypothetical protein n=2 Tax=Avibacterium avium TaxID=751 RepID=UPI003BF78F5A
MKTIFLFIITLFSSLSLSKDITFEQYARYEGLSREDVSALYELHCKLFLKKEIIPAFNEIEVNTAFTGLGAESRFDKYFNKRVKTNPELKSIIPTLKVMFIGKKVLGMTTLNNFKGIKENWENFCPTKKGKNFLKLQIEKQINRLAKYQ